MERVNRPADKNKITYADLSAVILAGGAAKRFGGKNKLQTIIGGERIIDRVIVTLAPVFNEIIIVTNTPEEYNHLKGCQVTEDQFKGAGPLGGIHAAMMLSVRKGLFVFAGDMPYLDGDIIRDQISFAGNNSSDAIIPEVKEYIEPLHGIYMNHLAGSIERRLSSGADLSIRGFLKTINVMYFRPEISDKVLRAFININYPADADNHNQSAQH